MCKAWGLTLTGDGEIKNFRPATIWWGRWKTHMLHREARWRETRKLSPYCVSVCASYRISSRSVHSFIHSTDLYWALLCARPWARYWRYKSTEQTKSSRSHLVFVSHDEGCHNLAESEKQTQKGVWLAQRVPLENGKDTAGFALLAVEL